jgi:hypothetical protein
MRSSCCCNCVPKLVNCVEAVEILVLNNCSIRAMASVVLGCAGCCVGGAVVIVVLVGGRG